MQISDIGSRLKEERLLRGMNQEEFGALGEVKKNAQSNYENGARKPDTEYLELIAKAGVDVAYILTGKRKSATTPLDEAVIEVLKSRGITIEEDQLFGSRLITFASAGMAWLLNYLDANDVSAPMLSWSLLGDLAAFEPGAGWRQLRIKAAALPVREGVEYFVYFYYLNGTPPHQLHMFRPDNRTAEGGIIRYSATRERPFRIGDDQDVMMMLNDDEQIDLLDGQVLTIDPVGSPAGQREVTHDEARPAAKPGRKKDQSLSGQSSRSAKRDTP